MTITFVGPSGLTSVPVLQARRFPEGSDFKLFYEVGLQQLLICFTVVILISGVRTQSHRD